MLCGHYAAAYIIIQNSLPHQKLLLASCWSSCRSPCKVGMVSLIRRTLIKIAPSHQNCIPFHFSYHEDHCAGCHAECLNRWNVITPQKNSSFCNNMTLMCSLILPRFLMATANHLLVYYSEEWWPLLPAQPAPAPLGGALTLLADMKCGGPGG